MKKVFVFADLGWSIGRVHYDVARRLPDIEFTFSPWGGYNTTEVIRLFNECDVCITPMHCVSFFKTQFPMFDRKKCLFIGHGQYDHTNFTEEDCQFVYGITSDAIRNCLPENTKVFVTPNGVEHTMFDYIERTGELKNVGWCGAPNVPYKQAGWGLSICRDAGVKFIISSSAPCEDDFSKWGALSYEEIRKWYSTIDILIVTAQPEAMSETGPLPPFEAIVSGIPVIGTPVGNFRHVPGPKFTTIEQATSILLELKSDPERMKSLAKEQYEYVMANYTYKSFIHKWREALEYVHSLQTTPK